MAKGTVEVKKQINFGFWANLLPVLVRAFCILVPMCTALVSPSIGVWLITCIAILFSFRDRVLLAHYLWSGQKDQQWAKAMMKLSEQELARVKQTPLEPAEKAAMVWTMLAVFGTDIELFLSKNVVFYHVFLAVLLPPAAMFVAVGVAVFCVIGALFNQYKAFKHRLLIKQYQVFKRAESTANRTDNAATVRPLLIEKTGFIAQAQGKKNLLALPFSQFQQTQLFDAEKWRFYQAYFWQSRRMKVDFKPINELSASDQVIVKYIRQLPATASLTMAADVSAALSPKECFKKLLSAAYGWRGTFRWGHAFKAGFVLVAGALIVIGLVLKGGLVLSATAVFSLMFALLAMAYDVWRSSWQWGYGEDRVRANVEHKRLGINRLPWPIIGSLLSGYAGTIFIIQQFLLAHISMINSFLSVHIGWGVGSAAVVGPGVILCMSTVIGTCILWPFLKLQLKRMSQYILEGVGPNWCSYDGTGQKINLAKAVFGVVQAIVPLWYLGGMPLLLYMLLASCQLVETYLYLDMYYYEKHTDVPYGFRGLIAQLRQQSEARKVPGAGHLLLRHSGASQGAQDVKPPQLSWMTFLCDTAMTPYMRFKCLLALLAVSASNMTRTIGSFCALLLFCNMIFLPFTMPAYALAGVLTLADVVPYVLNAYKSWCYYKKSVSVHQTHDFGVDLKAMRSEDLSSSQNARVALFCMGEHSGVHYQQRASELKAGV